MTPQRKQPPSDYRGKEYFVFIAADADRNRLNFPSALQLAKYRLERKEWGLKVRTRYRRHMKADDRVLIYLSGHRESAQHFIGEATIASGPNRNLNALVDAPSIYTSVCSEFKVELKNIRFFKFPVCARDLLKHFEFIAPNRRKMWRIYFQGGAIRLPKKDFDLVLSKTNSGKDSY